MYSTNLGHQTGLELKNFDYKIYETQPVILITLSHVTLARETEWAYFAATGPNRKHAQKQCINKYLKMQQLKSQPLCQHQCPCD